MVKVVKGTQKHSDLIKYNNLIPSENIYLIKNNKNEVCGLIEYHISQEHWIKIEHIIVFDKYRRNNIATAAVNCLKTKFQEYKIYGNSLPTETSVAFWKSVGAILEFNMNLEDYKINNKQIPFIIH